MKIRFFSVLSVCFVLSLFVALYPAQGKQINGDDPHAKEALIVRGVISALEQLHYQPIVLDDEVSKKAYKAYLESLDGGKRFLTLDEVKQLKAYETSIDDEFKAGTFKFFNLSVQLIDNGVERAKNLFPQFLEKPFDFNENESIVIDLEKVDYPASAEAMKVYWKQLLKYEVLTKLQQKIEDQKKDGFEGEQKSVKVLEEETRAEVKKTFDDWFERLQKLRRADRFNEYVNSVSELFDPHTTYFDPKEKEDFDIGMSGRLEGIGARLQNEGEYTKIESIVPGGPAWKQKELEVGDLIMKVSQDKVEFVDIRGMRVDDVVKYIRGKKGTKVTLQVKKADASVQEITIERDEVILDESFARSSILEQSDVIDNIGYIRLPKFYADFERENGNSCAKDVAIEIEKLKRQNVKGIILDLRSNGGGSLRDVVDMSGLFIEEGPIVQVKSRNQAPQVLRDADSRVQYNGPLIVLVNTFSASASEILAAALQDYGRALIVGSESTFGKGTVQRFYDLDRLIKGNLELKPLGEVKLTMQKFYRINGGSTQLEGVVPDVILPDNLMYLELGEREYEYPMEWSEIAALSYDQDAYKLKNLQGIQQRSKSRISQDTVFQKIEKNALRLKEQRELVSMPLNLNAYDTFIKEKEKQAKQFENIMKDNIPGFNVKNLEEDIAYIQVDSSRIARNDDWISNLKKDVYLQESLHLMKDMIQYNKDLTIKY